MGTAYQLPLITRKTMTLAHPDGGRVVQLVNHWLANSGPEWTVNRLKAIRTACLQLRGGDHSVVRQIYQESSIGYTKNDLLPRGPFRSIVREYSQTQSPIALRRLDLILRCYTSVRLCALSKAQFDKAFKAITGPYQGSSVALVDARKLIEDGAGYLGLPQKSRLKRPDLRRLKPGTSTHSEGRRPKDHSNIPYGRLAWSLVTSCAAPEGLMDYFPQADGFRLLCIDGGADETTTGHIAFLQEKGAKARVVAVPNAWHQWLFEPLHRLLDDLAKDLSCSAVHDQNKGAWFIQECQGNNLPLACFDLSSATDRFPRELQMHLLDYLGLNKYSEALEQTCQAWRVTAPPYFTGKVNYAVGQPMGLYGSFPLFHLTHCCLLAGIARYVGLPASSMSFMVLGDDVLVSNMKVAKLYNHLMRDLGVDISRHKSIVSYDVAEFAGFVGVKTNKGSTTYRPYKHDDRGIVNNPIGLLYSLGHRLSTYPKWKQWVRDFERTRRWRYPDLSPIVPIDDGWGINPQTISPERFAILLHQSELVALDPESLDYVVPEFEYSEDWEDIVGELFNKQSPGESKNLIDSLRSQERHGIMEKPRDDALRNKYLERPPSALTKDPVMRQFAHEGKDPVDDSGSTAVFATAHAGAEATRENSSREDIPERSKPLRRMNLF